jgi:DNA polymerase-2
MWCGHGDTDPTFVWLGGAHFHADAERIGQALVAQVNGWWCEHLRTGHGLESSPELEFDIRYARLPMSTLRGSYEVSKKRYAGLVLGPYGGEQVACKGLETVRSDWSPLAQQLQQELYLRIFKGQPYEDWIREYVARTLRGDLDELLVYRKRLRRPLDDDERKVPPHVRAARMADAFHTGQGRPARYRKRGQIRDVVTTNGPNRWSCAARLSTTSTT